MMSSEDWAILPILLPLIGAALSFCAKAFLKGRPGRLLEYAAAFVGLVLPWAALVALAPMVFNGGSIVAVIGGWPASLGIVTRFDGLAWLVDALGFTVAGAAWIYSLGAGPRGPAFTAIFLIQASALAATVSTSDVFNLFVCLEVLGMASYVLVVSSGKPGAYLAAYSYLMVSAAAMVFFLAGVYGLYRLTGSLSYDGIAAGLRSRPDAGGLAAITSLASISAAVALRVAIMPLYGWLPEAHAQAPHAVSAVLSGVLIKTPLFALFRILTVLPGGGAVGELLGYAGAATALVGVVIALSQKDAKRLLAYHSISQIGYVIAAWGAGVAALGRGDPVGAVFLTAAYLHALYHALFKGLLFLTVGTATDAAGDRDVYRLRGIYRLLRSSGERFPFTTLSFATGALAICAIPPLNGYASKAALSYVLKGRWEYGMLLAASVGTVASFIKLSRIFFPSRKAQAEAHGSARVLVSGFGHRTGLARILAQLILATLCLVAGLAAPRVSTVVGRALGTFGMHPLPPNLYSAHTLTTTFLVVMAGLALYFLTVSRPGRWIAGLIRETPRGFHGLFSAFSAGLVALVVWMFFSTR